MEFFVLERISSLCFAPSRRNHKERRIHELSAVDMQACFLENLCSNTNCGGSKVADSGQYRSTEAMKSCVLAVFFNDYALVKRLVHSGLRTIPLHHTDQADYSAFHAAAAMGRTEIIAMLLEDGYLPGQSTRVNGRNAIHLACIHGREEALQILLSHGGLDYINAVDANDETPLQLAIMRGHKCIVDTLIQAQCKVRISVPLACRTGPCGTPLIHAAVYEQMDIMKRLLRAGAEIDEKGPWGATALHWASRKGNTRMVRYLLSKGANPRTSDAFGCIPSGVAQFGQHIDAANILALFESRSAYPCGKLVTYSSLSKTPVSIPKFKYLPMAMEGNLHIGKAQQFGAYKWILDMQS